MAINNAKVDEMTLALLYLTTFKDKHGPRVWEDAQLGCPRPLTRERLHSRGSDEGEVGDAEEEGAERVQAPV
ncbi:MAG: hypothetical protein WCA27_07565 [Candidatus Sulfotelmatobacter sp.]